MDELFDSDSEDYEDYFHVFYPDYEDYEYDGYYDPLDFLYERAYFEEEYADSENETSSEDEEFDLEEKVSEALAEDCWPAKFYDLPKPTPVIYDDPESFARKFVGVIYDQACSNEAHTNCASEAKRAKIDKTQNEKTERTLLDLPQHILDKVLFYLCCDEPSNRRNRHLRNLAATCTGLKRFVNQSYVPDYLELGIMCVHVETWPRVSMSSKNMTSESEPESSDLEQTSELQDESTEHEELEVYSKFLDQVNWRIKKLRLVISKWQEENNYTLKPSNLPILRWFELEELTVDFSEFYDIEDNIAERIDVEDFLRKLPKLQSISIISTVDLKISHRRIQQNQVTGIWSWKSLKQFIPKDRVFLVNWDYFRVELCALSFSYHKSVTHVSFNKLDPDDLHILSGLPSLTSLCCLRLNLEKGSAYYDLETETPVFNKVASLVIRCALDYRDQSYFLPKMFPRLQTYETLIKDKEDKLEIITTQRTQWWTFQNLASVSIFLYNTNFSDHLCSLKILSCLKNLCIEVFNMNVELQSVMKIFDRSDVIKPEFNLELLRLETQRADRELDEEYSEKLLPNVLQFETLDVCILSSYHNRKLVPEKMKNAVRNHERLKYFRFGDQVLRYPESNKGLESKHKWCKSRLYLS